MDYELMMRQALQVANEALSSGDVPIGAIVISPDGEVIGEGRNERECGRYAPAYSKMRDLCAAREGDWS